MVAGSALDWQPPTRFDGYRLIRLLGAGAMGRVYLGHDQLLDRSVAIKFIAKPDEDGRRRQRFLVEGRALARLVHPNVVLTFRVGEVEGRPFLVSEFVDGRSLDQLPKPLPIGQVVDIGLGLARGLSAVHAAGILHRDIKPANAMLGGDGVVKLIDFGVAKLVDDDDPPACFAPPVETVTQEAATEAGTEPDRPLAFRVGPLSRAGAALGTRRYMSPERLAGEAASPSSDIFALGCVLHELAHGWLPGDEESNRTLSSPDLQPVLSRCLDPDPARRCPSADMLLQELEAVAADTVDVREIPAGNPYRGLEAFDAEHRALFLGRAGEVRAVLARLRTDAVVVIAGDSGVGKSSLCKAGVLPLVGEQGLLPDRGALVLQMTPGRDPIGQLAQALATALNEPVGVIRDKVVSEPTEVLRALGRVSDERTVVLFVDQTEELLTLAPSEQRAAFAGALAAWARAGNQFRLLATVRGDFLARLASVQDLGPEVARAPYLLRPLNPEKLREVIAGPARRTGVSFASEETVADLMRAALSSDGALPLLQFTLAELWEARDRDTNVIRAETLAKLGGLEGALERHADRVLRALSPQKAEMARNLLSRLVTHQRTRASLTKEDLGELSPEQQATLEALISGRLVVVRGSDDMAVYELAHEALIVCWSTLRNWIEEEAAQKRTREHLGAAAAEWNRLGRRGEGLWGGRQLAGLTTMDLTRLAPRERAFLAACRGGQRKARMKRVAAPLVVIGAVAIAVVGARLRARAQIAATAARSHDTARELERDAAKRDSEGARLRVQALRLFDQGVGLDGYGPEEKTWSNAEQMWEQMKANEAAADTGHARAGAAFETALFIDPSRADVREELTALTTQRIALASRMYRRDREEELRQRLELLRASTAGAGTDERTAVLSLSPPSGGVAVSVAAYVEDSSGRLALGAARPLAPGDQRLAPGSYLIVAQAAGAGSVRLPVLIERGRRKSVALPPIRSWTTPSGFVLVADGDALVGAEEESLRRALDVPPLHAVRVASFLISRFEVTFGDYIEWLETLSEPERLRRTPKVRAEPGALELRAVPGRRWMLILQPIRKRYVAGWGEPVRYEGRRERSIQDWRRFPVTGISFEDMKAYAAWMSTTGRVHGARVCGELEWEKAARGVDGRIFTTGRQLQPSEANFDLTYGGTDLAFGPDEVGSHPESASPFGVEDMNGNAYELLASRRWNESVAARGGSWYLDRIQQRLDNRFRAVSTVRDPQAGFRVCADPTP